MEVLDLVSSRGLLSLIVFVWKYKIFWYILLMKFLVSSTERQEVWSPHCISNEAINQYSLQKITPGWLAARRIKNCFSTVGRFSSLFCCIPGQERNFIPPPSHTTRHSWRTIFWPDVRIIKGWQWKMSNIFIATKT